MPYTSAQIEKHDVIAIGWKTISIYRVTDCDPGNAQVAGPTGAAAASPGNLLRKNIKVCGSRGKSTVIHYGTPLDPLRNSAVLIRLPRLLLARQRLGPAPAAISGAVTTTIPNALILETCMTTGDFSRAGKYFTSRIITTPDRDIVQDRFA